MEGSHNGEPSKEEMEVKSARSPRRSPPPLVSVEASARRDSLVGLQRLVYSTQVFSTQIADSDKRGIKDTTDNDELLDLSNQDRGEYHVHENVVQFSSFNF